MIIEEELMKFAKNTGLKADVVSYIIAEIEMKLGGYLTDIYITTLSDLPQETSFRVHRVGNYSTLSEIGLWMIIEALDDAGKWYVALDTSLLTPESTKESIQSVGLGLYPTTSLVMRDSEKKPQNSSNITYKYESEYVPNADQEKPEV